MPTESCVIGGVKLVYEKEGSGPPVVFIPAALLSAVEWEGVIPFFMADYTCYVVELRGHGRSDHAPDGDYSMRAFTEEAAELVRQVVGEPSILIGSGEGGLVAMGVAAHHPELVRAVYSGDVVPATGAGEGIPESLLAFIRGMADVLEQNPRGPSNLAQFTAGMVRALPAFAANDPATLNVFARLWFGADPAYARTDNAYDSAEARYIETGIHCPLHIARADAAFGATVSEGQIDALREAGVKFTTTYFPEAGHVISIRQLKACIEDIRAFLARV
jgi:pimeloyl-ACP methyl ester carboxylesterase